MKLIARGRYADVKLATELGVELADLDDVLRRADVVNLSRPLTSETHHFVSAYGLALMKPT
jgi:phosphoglycerate dehydrogenase-like enzyme